MMLIKMKVRVVKKLQMTQTKIIKAVEKRLSWKSISEMFKAKIKEQEQLL